MKRFLVLLFLLFPLQIFSQKIVPLKAKEVNNYSDWTVVGTTTEKVFTFEFGKKKHNYSGFVSVVVWADTSVSGALPTTVLISGEPLFFDRVGSITNTNGGYEPSPAHADSVIIKASFNIATNHTDDVYSVSKALNILSADGFKVYVYNTHATLTMQVRVELRMSEDR